MDFHNYHCKRDCVICLKGVLLAFGTAECMKGFGVCRGKLLNSRAEGQCCDVSDCCDSGFGECISFEAFCGFTPGWHVLQW